MNLAIDYDLLAEKIAARLVKQPNDNEVLWTSKECAEYLNMSYKHFMGRIISRSDFPKRVADGRSWRKADIVKWATRRVR